MDEYVGENARWISKWMGEEARETGEKQRGIGFYSKAKKSFGQAEVTFFVMIALRLLVEKCEAVKVEGRVSARVISLSRKT